MKNQNVRIKSIKKLRKTVYSICKQEIRENYTQYVQMYLKSYKKVRNAKGAVTALHCLLHPLSCI